MTSVDEPSTPPLPADFLTGLAFVGFGGLVALEAWRMPSMAAGASSAYAAPGLVPGLLGLLLLLLGLVLALRAARAGGWRLTGLAGAVRRAPRDARVRRLLLCLALTVGYAGILVAAVRAVPFPVSTFLFVLTFILLFDWKAGRSRLQMTGWLALALVMGISVAAVVTAVFERVFFLRLP